MTKNKPLIVDAASDESISKISPNVPIFHQKSSWHGIKVSYYQHLTGFETPEHCFSQHFITIHLNRTPVVKEQVINNRLRCDRFKDGDICLTPANVPVSVSLEDASELICLYLDPKFISDITENNCDGNYFELLPQFKLNDPLIYQIGMALKVNLESKGTCQRFYTESMATAISAHLLQFYSTQKPKIKSYSDGLPQTRLKQVTEYINEHSAENPSLMVMAQMVQISPYYFSRLFKKSTGLTPHQYLLKCRTDRAKRLLKTSDLSVATIAAQVGFTDQSHLTRHFKRLVGVSPSQFRA